MHISVLVYECELSDSTFMHLGKGIKEDSKISVFRQWIYLPLGEAGIASQK